MLTNDDKGVKRWCHFISLKYLQRSLFEAGRGYSKPLCSGLREPLPDSKRRGVNLFQRDGEKELRAKPGFASNADLSPMGLHIMLNNG